MFQPSSQMNSTAFAILLAQVAPIIVRRRAESREYAGAAHMKSILPNQRSVRMLPSQIRRNDPLISVDISRSDPKAVSLETEDVFL